jgi:hypothetical protein
MTKTFSFLLIMLTFCGFAKPQAATPAQKSIRDFEVLPTNDPATNKTNLQKAIDWASPRGAALYVDPSDEPYRIASGIVLKMNVSLIGVHGPVGRGTRSSDGKHPVGSVFAIEDAQKPFITVEGATQVRGIQFWYPQQTIRDPKKVIEYPPTIQASQSKSAQGVTLSCLTFFGEFIAMDFNCSAVVICEQVLIEHCYGYPLSGEFVRIDYCYDIPRVLHCHINPSNLRYFTGDYSRAVIDSVIARKSFAYAINHTDNAQVMDVFTFGTFGGIYLGPATYGQLTNFNFDCVSVGIHKLGDSSFNRNWQIAQGSIIANVEPEGKIENIHPIIIEGQGHTAMSNVEAFAGENPAVSAFKSSQDFLLVRGNRKLTVSLVGSRMRNYAADVPFTIQNPKAVVQAVACIDKHENAYELRAATTQPAK